MGSIASCRRAPRMDRTVEWQLRKNRLTLGPNNYCPGGRLGRDGREDVLPPRAVP
jgi:hypothetical protein